MIGINWDAVGAVATAGAFCFAVMTYFWGRSKNKTVNYLCEHLKQVTSERVKLQNETRSAMAELTEAKSLSRQAVSRLQRACDAFQGDEKDIWLRTPFVKPSRYDRSLQGSIPIVLVANLKGGVGKTTIAANLAAYFEDERNERVLAIDLDYQGSLSSMLFPESRRDRRTTEHAMALIGGGLDGKHIASYSYPIVGSRNDSRVIPCAHRFANHETRLLVEWVVGQIEEDIRYNLAHVLLSDTVQSEFDRIVIDTPPRVTAGFVNALCTSTHLLVPTVLDALSADGVGSFLNDVKRLKATLCPRLQLIGIIGTMKRTNTDQLQKSENNALEALRRVLRKEEGSDRFLLKDGLIPRKESVAQAAGLRIVYREDGEFRNLFKCVGDMIFTRAPTRREPCHEDRYAVQAV